MNNIKILLIMIAMIFTMNSCLAVAAAGAGAAGGYYCGKTSKCTR